MLRRCCATVSDASLALRSFKQRTQKYKEQCLRYCFSPTARPLLLHSSFLPPNPPAPCSLCGAPRHFEFQVHALPPHPTAARRSQPAPDASCCRCRSIGMIPDADAFAFSEHLFDAAHTRKQHSQRGAEWRVWW